MSAPLPPPPASSFASDNAAGVHPAVMEALARANHGHALAYGADDWTRRVEERFAELLGECTVHLCWGGTGANVVALQTLLRPWQSVICATSAHINVDECGAPERITGNKLIDLPTVDGKLTPDQVTEQLHVLGDEHHTQPRVVAITQSTESGTVYSLDEIAALADTAHRHGLLLFIDGARIANAAAALGGDARALLRETGVDVVTFGGTKNGLMYGEAVVHLTPELGADTRFVRKQHGQLISKMRYVAAQFEALLTDGLWLRNADHANAMARRLADAVRGIPGVELQREPEVNSVFAVLPEHAIAPLAEWCFFWTWDPLRHEVRWMTSWDTTPADIDRFAAGIAAVTAAHRTGTRPSDH